MNLLMDLVVGFATPFFFFMYESVLMDMMDLDTDLEFCLLKKKKFGGGKCFVLCCG